MINPVKQSRGDVDSEILMLDLFANGTAVKDLVEPIQLSIPSAGTEPAVCAFLDEETNEWSRAGVSVVSIQNGTIVCATTHLSIFGAILESAFAALACSNAAAIFSEQGLRSLGSRLWIFEWPAVLSWIILLLGVFLLAQAGKADRKHEAALAEIHVITDLKRKDAHHAESLCEVLMEEFKHAIDTGPVRIAYSRMLRAKVGLSLKQLQKLHQESGHTSVHTRAEEFLKDFEDRNLGRRLSFWYRMNCVWFAVLQPSVKASCMVRTSVLLGKVYSGWALSAVFYGASSIAPGEEATGGLIAVSNGLSRL